MTRDEVLRIGRQAGAFIEAAQEKDLLWLERFAALVMEEDAKVCDALKDDETQFNAAVEKQLKGNDEARQLHALRMLSNVQLYNAGFIKSAAAIRARKP